MEKVSISKIAIPGNIEPKKTTKNIGLLTKAIQKTLFFSLRQLKV